MELSLTHQKSLRKIAPSSKHLFVAGLPRHLNKYSRIDRQDEARWLPVSSLPQRGIRNRPRDAIRARFCRSLQAVAKQSSVARRTRYRLVAERRTGWLRFTRHDERGKRNAERRRLQLPHLAVRHCPCGGSAPLGVPPRLSPGGFRPFRSAPGQASWDAVARHIGWTGVTRPYLSQSRECTSRTGRSTGEHDARSCPGADCKSARGHRTRSAFRFASGSRPLRERDSRYL